MRRTKVKTKRLLEANKRLMKIIPKLEVLSEREKAFCQTLLQQFQDTRKEIKHLKDKWTAVYGLGKSITSTFQLEKLLSLIAKSACEVLGAEACRILLINKSGWDLSFGGGYRLAKGDFHGEPLGFENNITWQIYKTRKALAIKNIVKDTRFNKPELFGKGKIFGSCLCAPVLFNGKMLGSFFLYSKSPRKYKKADIRTITSLTYQAAIAIQNNYLYTDVHVNYFNTIRALVLAMEARDPYTRGHSERVTRYAMWIARRLGLDPEQIQMIRYCGRLHDVGKIGISDMILNKPGRLNTEERAQVRLHTSKGAEMLRPLKFLEPGIPLVRHHHEWFDGSGYPDGLRGEQIPMAARILACADAFDAMTSRRPYRGPLTLEQALRELKDNAGRQFDPKVVEVFLKRLEKVALKNNRWKFFNVSKGDFEV